MLFKPENWYDRTRLTFYIAQHKLKTTWLNASQCHISPVSKVTWNKTKHFIVNNVCAMQLWQWYLIDRMRFRRIPWRNRRNWRNRKSAKVCWAKMMRVSTSVQLSLDRATEPARPSYPLAGESQWRYELGELFLTVTIQAPFSSHQRSAVAWFAWLKSCENGHHKYPSSGNYSVKCVQKDHVMHVQSSFHPWLAYLRL